MTTPGHPHDPDQAPDHATGHAPAPDSAPTTGSLPAVGGGRRRAAGPTDAPATPPTGTPVPGRRARSVAPDSAPTTGSIPVVSSADEAPAATDLPASTEPAAAKVSEEVAADPETGAPEASVPPSSASAVGDVEVTAPEVEAPQTGAEEEPDPEAPARRRLTAGGRRIDPVLLLSLVIPLATVAALATVHPAATEDGRRAPGEAPLNRSLVVCPAGLPGSEDVSVALADPAASGAVQVVGADPLDVRPAQVAVRRSGGTVVLEGTGATAVGLVAVRGDAALGTACQAPRSDVWFTGVGAGPEHTSRLRLVNPDSGPAVADVEVLTADGPVEVKALRGLAVAPHEETVVDLDAVVPEREDMSIRVTVPRGRLALSMTDTFAEIGSDVSARSWLGPQRAGNRTTHLLGVERGAGERTLVLANAGQDEARVTIKLVTAESEFAPTGVEDVTVAPGSTRTVELGNLLRSDQADGVLGLRLDSEVPVTATLRTVRGRRVQHTVGASAVRQQAATVVPGGRGALVLGGTTGTSTVTVTQRSAAGKQTGSEKVTVRSGAAVRFALGRDTGFVHLAVDGEPVRAAVVAGAGDPAQVRVLEELQTTAAVPHVRPALK